MRLFAIDEITADTSRAYGYSERLTLEFLRENSHLVVDTRFFDECFRDRLLASFENLSEVVDGVLVNGDNFQALRLLRRRFAGSIQCMYIDPPFNTDGDGFAYKDRYRHSSWLSLMDNRISVAKDLLTPDGTFYVHIDYGEKERLRLLLDQHLEYITEIIWRIGWLSGYKTKANKFIRNHDTIYQYGKTEKPLFIKTYIPYPEGYVRRDGNPPQGEGYPLEDTWNSSEVDKLNSIQIVSFSKEKVGNDQLTQKNEDLVERMLVSSSRTMDWVMDFFLGSGTTCAAAQKMARRWIGIEVGDQFVDYVLPRLKRVLYGDRYGISGKYKWHGGGCFQYMTLESYEDTLNNLEVKRPETVQHVLDESPEASEDYMLRYMLDLETRDSASLLNLEKFEDPFNYELQISDGGETRATKVDLVETFNWLLGLRVQKLRVIDGYRTVEGLNPDDERVLVIWRSLKDERHSNEALERFFREQWYGRRSGEEALSKIYVNGDNTLTNLRETGSRWDVLLLEEEFRRLMWAPAGEGVL